MLLFHRTSDQLSLRTTAFSVCLIDDQCTKASINLTGEVSQEAHAKKVELGKGGNRSSFQLPTPSQSSEEEKKFVRWDMLL